jgi:hypothetical protein
MRMSPPSRSPSPALARPALARSLEGADRLLARVRGEFREMPGLCLTVPQACRLWQLDAQDCICVLGVLVAEGFLARTAAGAYIARQ